MASQITPVLSLVFALALALAGCAHVTEQVVEHKPADATISGRVPWQGGEFLLWEIRSEGHEHQLQACQLKKGEVIGFDTAGGQLTAVAGANRYPLPPGWYRWYRTLPRGEQTLRWSVSIAFVPFIIPAFMGGGG